MLVWPNVTLPLEKKVGFLLVDGDEKIKIKLVSQDDPPGQVETMRRRYSNRLQIRGLLVESVCLAPVRDRPHAAFGFSMALRPLVLPSLKNLP